jgi:hypothetical protein
LDDGQTRRRRRKYWRTDLSQRWWEIIEDHLCQQPLSVSLLLFGPREEIALANDLARLGERDALTASDVEYAIAGRQVTPLVIALLLAGDREASEKRAVAPR